jgi:branched-chain amino acid transport system permease protein
MMKKYVIYLLLVAILITLPLFFGEYYVNLGSQIMVAVVFSGSLNLIVW